MSILDQTASLGRRAACDCGGTILTGCSGTEEEHSYCDSCDWVQHRSETESWITWRTDAAHGGFWAASAQAALAQLVAEREWSDIDASRETHDIANGAWLTIYEDGIPVLTRGQMP
jgi:hypothetical protein